MFGMFMKKDLVQVAPKKLFEVPAGQVVTQLH
jgi:hypothetical protein